MQTRANDHGRPATVDTSDEIDGAAGRGRPVNETSMLLERDDELACLSSRIDAAFAGAGSTVAVEGPAGIGKSSLLRATAALARDRGMHILTASGGELECDFAYGVVRQFFEPEVARDRRARPLAGAARFAAPALGLVGEDLPATADEHATLHGLYWLTANMAAERPLLLLLDDAHWADPASQRFVAYLARRVQELPLVIVYAARTGDGAMTGVPSQACPGAVDTVLWPRPLTACATSVLLGDLLDGAGADADHLAQACHTATGGNPFFLRELARELATAGAVALDVVPADRIEDLAPRSITHAIVLRLRRLGHEATELAFALAVIGTQGHLRQVADVAGLGLEAAGRAADELAGAGIFSSERPLRFAHPVVRSAVYVEISPARRARGHRRAAAVLDRDGATADVLAPHLLACEPAGDEWVVERLQAAAAMALNRGAPDAACVYLQRALDEPPPRSARASVLLALGSAELHCGRATAVDRLRDSLALASETSLQAEAAEELTLAIAATDRGAEAVRILDTTIAQLATTDPEAAMRLDALLISIAQVDSVTPKLATERLARYGDDLRGDTAVERLLLASLAFEHAVRGESRQRALQLAERALTDGLLLSEQPPDSPSFNLVALTFAFADELERAERLLDDAVEDARARGSMLGYPIAVGCRTCVLVRQGRLAEAEADARSALEPCLAEGWPVGVAMLVPPLLRAMIERASLGACEELLLQTHSAGEPPSTAIANMLLYSRGELRLAQGDPAAALHDFEELLRRVALTGVVNLGEYNARAAAALAHARLGNRESALALAHDALAVSRRWGAPSAVSTALRSMAAAVADNNERIDLLREATTTVARSPARYEHARGLVDLGAALRRAGQRRDARGPLRAALELAVRCGALRLAERAREELLATGARPRRAALAGRDALTPCERRVAAMAADGLGNRDIAQALFVTVRTVETHLSHVYAKLDICSRDRLADALTRDTSGEPAAVAVKNT